MVADPSAAALNVNPETGMVTEGTAADRAAAQQRSLAAVVDKNNYSAGKVMGQDEVARPAIMEAVKSNTTQETTTRVVTGVASMVPGGSALDYGRASIAADTAAADAAASGYNRKVTSARTEAEDERWWAGAGAAADAATMGTGGTVLKGGSKAVRAGDEIIASSSVVARETTVVREVAEAAPAASRAESAASFGAREEARVVTRETPAAQVSREVETPAPRAEAPRYEAPRSEPVRAETARVETPAPTRAEAPARVEPVAPARAETTIPVRAETPNPPARAVETSVARNESTVVRNTENFASRPDPVVVKTNAAARVESVVEEAPILSRPSTTQAVSNSAPSTNWANSVSSAFTPAQETASAARTVSRPAATSAATTAQAVAQAPAPAVVRSATVATGGTTLGSARLGTTSLGAGKKAAETSAAASTTVRTAAKPADAVANSARETTVVAPRRVVQNSEPVSAPAASRGVAQPASGEARVAAQEAGVKEASSASTRAAETRQAASSAAEAPATTAARKAEENVYQTAGSSPSRSSAFESSNYSSSRAASSSSREVENAGIGKMEDLTTKGAPNGDRFASTASRRDVLRKEAGVPDHLTDVADKGDAAIIRSITDVEEAKAYSKDIKAQKGTWHDGELAERQRKRFNEEYDAVQGYRKNLATEEAGGKTSVVAGERKLASAAADDAGASAAKAGEKKVASAAAPEPKPQAESPVPVGRRQQLRDESGVPKYLTDMADGDAALVRSFTNHAEEVKYAKEIKATKEPWNDTVLASRQRDRFNEEYGAVQRYQKKLSEEEAAIARGEKTAAKEAPKPKTDPVSKPESVATAASEAPKPHVPAARKEALRKEAGVPDHLRNMVNEDAATIRHFSDEAEALKYEKDIKARRQSWDDAELTKRQRDSFNKDYASVKSYQKKLAEEQAAIARGERTASSSAVKDAAKAEPKTAAKAEAPAAALPEPKKVRTTAARREEIRKEAKVPEHLRNMLDQDASTIRHFTDEAESLKYGKDMKATRQAWDDAELTKRQRARFNEEYGSVQRYQKKLASEEESLAKAEAAKPKVAASRSPEPAPSAAKVAEAAPAEPKPQLTSAARRQQLRDEAGVPKYLTDVASEDASLVRSFTDHAEEVKYGSDIKATRQAWDDTELASRQRNRFNEEYGAIKRYQKNVADEEAILAKNAEKKAAEAPRDGPGIKTAESPKPAAETPKPGDAPRPKGEIAEATEKPPSNLSATRRQQLRDEAGVPAHLADVAEEDAALVRSFSNHAEEVRYAKEVKANKEPWNDTVLANRQRERFNQELGSVESYQKRLAQEEAAAAKPKALDAPAPKIEPKAAAEPPKSHYASLEARQTDEQFLRLSSPERLRGLREEAGLGEYSGAANRMLGKNSDELRAQVKAIVRTNDKAVLDAETAKVQAALGRYEQSLAREAGAVRAQHAEQFAKRQAEIAQLESGAARQTSSKGASVAEVVVKRPNELPATAAKAEKALARELSDAEKRAVQASHEVGAGEVGRNGKTAGLGNYTDVQLRGKSEILRDAGFSVAERRTLMKNGVVGYDTTGTAAGGVSRSVKGVVGEDVMVPRSNGGWSAGRITAQLEDGRVRVDFDGAFKNIEPHRLEASPWPREDAWINHNPARVAEANPVRGEVGERVMVPRTAGGTTPGIISERLADGRVVVRFEDKMKVVDPQNLTPHVQAPTPTRAPASAPQLVRGEVGENVLVPRTGGGFSEGKITTRYGDGSVRVDFDGSYKMIHQDNLKVPGSVDPQLVRARAPPPAAAPVKAEAPKVASSARSVKGEVGEGVMVPGRKGSTPGKVAEDLGNGRLRVDVGGGKVKEFKAADLYPKNAGYEHLEKRGLLPQHEFKVGNQQVKVSDFFRDNGGRNFAVARIVTDGQPKDVVFYRSNSQALYRQLPSYHANGWYDKGIKGEEALTASPSMQAALNGLANKSDTKLMKVVDLEKLDGVIPVVEDRMDPKYLALQQDPHYASGSGYREYSVTKEAAAHVEDGVGRALEVPSEIKISNPSSAPVFDKPARTYEFESKTYGKVSAEVFPSRDGSLEYTVLKDQAGRIWFGDVGVANASLSEAGLRKDIIKAGNLTAPLWEYPQQIANGYSTGVKNGSYELNWNYIKEIPEVKRYYAEKRIRIPQ